MLGSEYLTSNTHIAYPFEENAPALAYDTCVHGLNATVPLDFLIDANITLPEGYTKLYLYSISKLVDGSSRFRFADQNGTVAFTYDLIPVILTETYQIVDMVSTVSRICVRFLISTSFNTYLAAIPSGGIDMYGTRLPFDSCVITYISRKVEQFEVDEPGITHVLTNDVTFKSGYNTVLKLANITDEDNKTIQIDVEPGTGEGLTPCVSATRTSIPLNLIPDSNGNIVIEGDECTNIVMQRSASRIELQSDCTQCCTCDDYLNSALAVKELISRADTLRKNLLNVHAKLTNAINASNAQAASTSEISMGITGAVGVPGSSRECNMCVYVINRSRALPISITNLHIALTGTVTHTSFVPSTLLPESGISYYFIANTTTPHGTWNINVTLSYTYNGVNKSLTQSVALS